ncbi:MAG: class I tRNA ligase family protein [Desulfobacterales bacterium]|nr:class I tRNA ligase family protein [Desulfobacterales bacterium]MBS3754217.1 class I tRNA ligase family protein [Desulfobacterales bacterium]
MPASLHLHNTMTRKKDQFIPRKPGRPVKMFTCGPSIYNWPHIGNYRTFLFEDILQRFLEYLGYRVDRLINFTDMEDKAIARANELGISLEDLTRPVADSFIRDCGALNIYLPQTIARSTTSVEQAVDLIGRLMEKNIAYRHGRDIFYDPLKFKGFGRLYGLDMRKWPKKRIRFRKDTYPGQRWNMGDFILWKGWRPGDGEIFWDTELGRGRPAWNVQDAAMIAGYLGEELDICCGGIDNLYRHHDYNIAVIEGVSGKELAPFWAHSRHVSINGAKMSKSRGNIVYVRELMDKGYAARHIRFFLVYGHYRSRRDLTGDRIHQARGKIDTFREMVRNLRTRGVGDKFASAAAKPLIDRLQPDFENRMNDDLDVKAAFDGTYNTVSQLMDMALGGDLGTADIEAVKQRLGRIDSVLQVLV